MRESTLWENAKEWIGSIGFKVFLWSVGMTAERYLEATQRECELTRKIASY